MSENERLNALLDFMKLPDGSPLPSWFISGLALSGCAGSMRLFH